MYTEYEYLAHSGIKGMKWGIRRYRNEDGTLTEAGKKRYAKQEQRVLNTIEKSLARNTAKMAGLADWMRDTHPFREVIADRNIIKHPKIAKALKKGIDKDISRYKTLQLNKAIDEKSLSEAISNVKNDPNYDYMVKAKLLPVINWSLKLLTEGKYDSVTANKYKVRPSDPEKHKNYKYYQTRHPNVPIYTI